MNSSYFSQSELESLGLGSFGRNVLVSRFARIYNPSNLFLGDHSRIDDFCFILASGKISIGEYVHISPFCLLSGRAGITMEDFSGLSSRVSLYSVTDDYSGSVLTNPTVPSDFTRIISGPIHLGRHVIIGSGAVILPSVTLEEGSCVGANALVRDSFAPWSVVVGSPARRVKERSRDLLEKEKALREWEKSRPSMDYSS